MSALLLCLSSIQSSAVKRNIRGLIPLDCFLNNFDSYPAAAKGHRMYGKHRSDFPVVVVIGDDATFRETLSKLCQSVGLNVLTFDSIGKFLGTKLPDAPACLVIDVSSPRLGRAKLHAQLARADVQIPIVPVSGAMNVGAVEILTRRLRDRSMLATIQIALHMDRARREVTKRATTH